MRRLPRGAKRNPGASIILVAVVAVSLCFSFATAAAAQDDDGQESVDEADSGTGGDVDPEQAARDAQLQQGATVYSQVCSSCHQPGGSGLPGQFPPLVDNPRVDDAAYMAETINNGLEGPLEVAGVSYDGVMPSFSTLSDDETDAVIAYIQNDFEAPQAALEAFEADGPVAGTELPGLASLTALVAFLVFASVVGLVLAPRLLSVNDRLTVPWLDVGLKTTAIVCSVALLTVFVPNWALNTTRVAKLSRFGQDVVGVGLFGLGLVTVLGGLWYAHRESRI